MPNRADGGHDLDAMAAAVTERTRMAIVCSPNNPTGPAVTAPSSRRSWPGAVHRAGRPRRGLRRVRDRADRGPGRPAARAVPEPRRPPHLLEGVRARRAARRVRPRPGLRARRRPRLRHPAVGHRAGPGRGARQPRARVRAAGAGVRDRGAARPHRDVAPRAGLGRAGRPGQLRVAADRRADRARGRSASSRRHHRPRLRNEGIRVSIGEHEAVGTLLETARSLVGDLQAAR